MKVLFLIMLLILFLMFTVNCFYLKRRKKKEPSKVLLINKEGIHFFNGDTKESQFSSINGMDPIYFNGIQHELEKLGTTAEDDSLVISKIMSEIDNAKENHEIKKSYAIARRTKSKRIRNKHINKIIKLENK